MFTIFSIITQMACLLNSPASAGIPIPGQSKNHSHQDRSFRKTINKVKSMVRDRKIIKMASRQGLSVLNVTWEDTGRAKNSSWGPNISDMTIGVRDQSGKLHPMPVIRFNNFNDKTADVRSDKFYLQTGNERSQDLSITSLKDLLKNTRDYLHDPGSWSGKEKSLWHKRDKHVLVSAQACFLPIPKKGKATFTPVIYNYQSSVGNPAVLTIISTREGTSMQVVENDSGYMSEVLYFNENGQRAPFTATRISDFKAQGGDQTTGASEVHADANLNAVLLIQVPLKHQSRRYFGYDMNEYSEPAAEFSSVPKSAKRGSSDVEQAVVGHGRTEGPYKEINDLSIERDSRFPVRVTVQFYKATSNGVVSAQDIKEVREQIDKVYASGDYVGSLVTGGVTDRPTEWVKPEKSNIWFDPDFSWHKAWDDTFFTW